MTWRTVVIQNKAKLSYKNDYLIIRNEEMIMIHLSEINILIIESTATMITSYLINELLSRKIKVVFCDEKRSPSGEIIPYYGCHNSSKKMYDQIHWDKDASQNVWTCIIKQKIKKQADYLKILNINNYEKLYQYLADVQFYDITNREGHAAKVYFNSLFGIGFSREDINDINSALNYGYAILLSQFNKELVSSGCLTQLGIKHCNEFNPYNLSCDIMEPFRPLVDRIVRENYGKAFGGTMKLKLIDVLNQKVRIKGNIQFVSNAISIYVKSVINAIERHDETLVEFFEYEL